MGFFASLVELLFGTKRAADSRPRADWDEIRASAADWVDDRHAIADEPAPVSSNEQAVNITGSGNFSYEVVGESRYQDNLARICGGKTEEGHELRVVATLTLEDSNQYDPKAVRVDVAGRTVGYLPRQTARKYRKQLAKAGHPTLNATCWAIIRGGWDRGYGDEGHFGVYVDLPKWRR